MIKKSLFALAALVGMSGLAMASDRFAHDASVLPKAAQSTLSHNLKSKVSLVKMDKDFGHISEYEVVMNDGTEVIFDKNGNWTDVEVNSAQAVPEGFIPDTIAKYVKANQSGQKIVGIEKDRGGYEVDLSNGVEMKFDRDGNFLRYNK